MRAITIILFVVYSVILVKVILFKGPVFYHVVSGADDYRNATSQGAYQGHNLVPFRTIKAFMNLHPSTSLSTKIFNVFGNIALFIPFGFLLPILFKRLDKFSSVLLATFLVSLFFELFQLATRTGHFDVDDLILNSSGGVFGYLVLRMAAYWYKAAHQKKQRVTI